jgi:hypothetical protein
MSLETFKFWIVLTTSSETKHVVINVEAVTSVCAYVLLHEDLLKLLASYPDYLRVTVNNCSNTPNVGCCDTEPNKDCYPGLAV